MLHPDLIRARRRKGIIRLLYASDDKESLAKTLVSVYDAHVGRTRGKLNEAVGGCEELGYDYKLVRGLSAILEERCVFQSRAKVLPIDARRAVFEEAANSVIATEDERKKLIATVAFRMGVSAGDLDRSLQADLPEEQEVAGFEEIRPSELLKEYNFSLTLALLAHARRLELTYRVKDMEIEELGGKLGKCGVSDAEGTSKMVVEWKTTSRFGYRAAHLEALLTRLMSKGGWGLVAEVVYPQNSRKINRFEISDKLEGKLIRHIRREQGLIVKAKPKDEHQIRRQKEEIIDIEEKALRLGVTESDVRRQFEGYVDLGGILITKPKLMEVKGAFESAVDMRFKSVRKMLRDLGCRNPLPVLEALGYAVDWTKDKGESRVYRLRGGKNS
jgi:hypothetical protein